MQEVFMYTYPWYHWITFFYIYCFFGWIFESTYVSIRKKHFVNRGFLRLPMLPLYGTGAVMMLWVSLPVKDNLFLVYIFGVIAATCLEYITGYVMERLFKMKYWDYSNQKFQLNGYICLSSSIAWGFLTIFLTEVIHRPIADLVLSMNPVFEFSFLVLVSSLFITDTIQSTKEALALGRALEAMSKMKAEMEELQLQLALLKSETRVRAVELKDDARLKVTELKETTRQRINELGEQASQLREELKASVTKQTAQFREEAAAYVSREAEKDASLLAERIRSLSERRQQLLESHRKITSHMSFYRKSLLKGNPTASSKRFAEALQELRDILEHK